MAFGHGKKGRVLFGKYDVSAFVKSFGTADTTDLAEVSVLTNPAGKTYLAGIGDGKVSFGGYFDGAASAIDAVLSELKTAAAAFAFMVCMTGYSTIGSRVKLGHGLLTNYSVDAGVDGAVEISGEVQADDGVGHGVLLADLAQRNATGNGSSVDNGALTIYGGALVLCVTEFTSLTNVVVKVQHSTDNSVWADLDSFVTVTAATSERRLIGYTTINRYLRATWTISGAGTFTAAVGFARR